MPQSNPVSIPGALMRLAAIVVGAVVLFALMSTAASAQALEDMPLEDLQQRLSDVRAEIGRHEKNLQRMKAEVALADSEGRSPDAQMLSNYLATVTGARSQAYFDRPKHIRDLIDDFETFWKNPVRDTRQTAMLAGSLMHAKYQFKVEIERTSDFLKIVYRENTKYSKLVTERDKLGQDLRKDAAEAAIEDKAILDDLEAQLAALQTEEAAYKKRLANYEMGVGESAIKADEVEADVTTYLESIAEIGRLYQALAEELSGDTNSARSRAKLKAKLAATEKALEILDRAVVNAQEIQQYVCAIDSDTHKQDPAGTEKKVKTSAAAVAIAERNYELKRHELAAAVEEFRKATGAFTAFLSQLKRGSAKLRAQADAAKQAVAEKLDAARDLIPYSSYEIEKSRRDLIAKAQALAASATTKASQLDQLADGRDKALSVATKARKIAEGKVKATSPPNFSVDGRLEGKGVTDDWRVGKGFLKDLPEIEKTLADDLKLIKRASAADAIGPLSVKAGFQHVEKTQECFAVLKAAVPAGDTPDAIADENKPGGAEDKKPTKLGAACTFSAPIDGKSAVEYASFSGEAAARQAFADGRTLFASGAFDRARVAMQAASDGALCQETRAAAAQSIAIIDGHLAAAESGTAGEAETRLAACDFAAAQGLIAKLPAEAPSRGRLETVLRQKVEAEKRARGLYRQASALSKENKFAAASGRLDAAAAATPCAKTQAAIEAARRTLAQRRAEFEKVLAAQMDQAVRACKFAEARQVQARLRELGSGPVLRMVSARLDDALAREKQAKTYYNQAKQLYETGHLTRARRGVEAARDTSRCDHTIAALNGSLAKIDAQIANRQDAELTLANQGMTALRECRIDQAEALLAQLTKGDAAHSDLAAQIRRERGFEAKLSGAMAAYEGGDHAGAVSALRGARASTVCRQNAERAAAAMQSVEQARLREVEHEQTLVREREVEEERLARNRQRDWERKQQAAETAATMARSQPRHQPADPGAGMQALGDILLRTLPALNQANARRTTNTGTNVDNIFDKYRPSAEQQKILDQLRRGNPSAARRTTTSTRRPSGTSQPGVGEFSVKPRQPGSSNRCAQLQRQLLAANADWQRFAKSSDGRRWKSKNDPSYKAFQREMQSHGDRLKSLNAKTQAACR